MKDRASPTAIDILQQLSIGTFCLYLPAASRYLSRAVILQVLTMVSASAFFASAVAVLGMIGSVSARPDSVECAIQFFATGMDVDEKSVIVSITRTDAYALTHLSEDQRTVIKEDFFNTEKAIVHFYGIVDDMDDKKITSTLHVDFTAYYTGCKFEHLSFDNILDNGGSANGSGNCYSVQQTCEPYGEASVYGLMYVDVHCDLPHANNPIRMKYTQNEKYVVELPDC